MIRHYTSIITVKTTEGDLPQSLYRVDNDCAEGLELLCDPLCRKRIEEPLWRFLSVLKENGLTECSRDIHDTWSRMWDKAIATAKTPPVKIAKLGEIWEYTGRLFNMSGSMYSVSFCAAEVMLVMYQMSTGAHRVAGKVVNGGIQLDYPDDWTCHGLLTDLIAKGKA